MPWKDLWHGILVSAFMIVGTAYFESKCQDERKRLQQRKGGPGLYRQALIMNFVNVQILGPVVYYITIVYCCHKGLTLLEQVQSVFGILVIEGVLYTLVHKAFHENRNLYWMHSFHHKFNDIILPSTACAVSVFEFSFAYMLPITFGAYIVKADRVSALLAAGIIGGTNLLIHTPFRVKTKLPEFLVSTSDHFRHHRKVTTDYSAPLFHFERMFAAVGDKEAKEL